MPIIPSTLEYDKTSLDNKLRLLYDNYDFCKKITGQNRFELHVDIVYKSFAQDRSVLSSLRLVDVINTINLSLSIDIYKSIDRPHLSIHLMANKEDWPQLLKDLKMLEALKNIDFELYLPSWFNLLMFPIKSQNWGYWLDLIEWQNCIIEGVIDTRKLRNKYNIKSKKVLIMTVPAGVSGQKTNNAIQAQAVAVSASLGKENVILDGGWKLEDITALGQGLRVVSYGSFWNRLELELY